MTIEAIASIASNPSIAPTAGTQAVKADANIFDSMVEHVAGLNQQMQANAASAQAVALGETDNLHQVMMTMERTRLSFDLLLQVRNKVLDAYQELMRMQI